jgi:alcohol dehydrogenase class IV
MQFQLRTAAAIVFGPGELRRLPELVAAFGLRPRVFLCTGARSLEAGGHLEPLLAGLAARGLTVTRFVVPGEPDVALCEDAIRRCRAADCQLVLAIGGGSVLDLGKAVAALAPQPGPPDVLPYLEDVGRGKPQPLTALPLPVCAVPTTAGSGSEVTRNAVLRVPSLAVKRSLRSDLMLPRLALIDPQLLLGAPRKVTAAAALDALTHLIEGYVSRGAQPTTDALARRGIELMLAALTTLGAQDELRSEQNAADLALASMWGGIVLANAGLGAVHGLVAPLGGLCAVAHGEGCACLLPATFAANAHALCTRHPHSPVLPRFDEIAALINANANASANANANGIGARAAAPARREEAFHTAAARLQALRRHLGVKDLASQGVLPAHIGPIIAQSRGSSMRYNPVELTDDELAEILRTSLVDPSKSGE